MGRYTSKKESKGNQTLLVLSYCLLVFVFFSIILATSVVTTVSDMPPGDNTLKLAAWNCRGIKSARPYLMSLMNKYDVIALSEHKLYEAELSLLDDINRDFHAFGRSSEDLRDNKYGIIPGHCGVALFWKSNLASSVKAMTNLGTDRVCVIKFSQPNHANIYIVSVYLPQSRCIISNYQEHIDALHSIMDVCSVDGDVIIIGDWNAHFGKEFGGRAWGRTSANGALANAFIEEHGMCIIDLIPDVCSGPNYTFCSDTGATSYIDHCVTSAGLAKNCVSCEVLEDEATNTSDHHAVYVNFVIDTYPSCTPVTPASRTSWDRVLKAGVELIYRNPLDAELRNYTMTHYPATRPSEWTCSDIDSVYRSVVSIIKDVGSRLPKVKMCHGVKPYWSALLSELVRKKKRAWKAWTENGRPRDPSNPYWRSYKDTKRQFRRELRRHSHQADLALAQQLDSAAEINQDLFWRLVNRKRKNRAVQVRPFQRPDGAVVTDIAAIREAWKDYYEELYSPKDLGYDNRFKENVQARLATVNLSPRNDSDLLREPVSTDEVTKLVKKLKNKKAPGPDGVQAEHIKLGGASIVRVLTDLFNAMINREHRPADLKQGLIVPIPKGRKDSSIPDNNRGITLSSVIAKTYDSVLVNRAHDWLRSVTDDLQGAKHKHCSCLHTTMLLREVISYGMQVRRSVYVALLDVRKAFDHVWTDGLFYKLLHLNMDPKLWRILRDAYDDFRVCVMIAGESSSSFAPKQGIHQGDVWSMPLYCLYNNDLIRELKACPYGVHMSGINCTCPTFVDDLTVIAWSKAALNRSLAIANKYSKTWRFLFGAEKSVLLCFGKDEEPKIDVVLGRATIAPANRHTHVGVPICTSGEAETAAINERMSACKQIFYTVKAVSPSAVTVSPFVMSKLYWSLCVAKLTYGVEVWPLSKKSVSLMERHHNQVAKSIQGLPQRTSDPASQAMLGWRSIESHLDFSSLMFLWQLLSLPASSLYNQLVISRLTDLRFARCGNTTELTSPVKNLFEIAAKYNLTESVNNMLDTGFVPTKNTWRSAVNTAVNNLQHERWKMSCIMYKKLRDFVIYVPSAGMLQWWHVCRHSTVLSRKCKTLIRLIAGESNLSSGNGRYMMNSTLCPLCCSYQEESVHHFLLECDGLKTVRGLLLPKVLDSMPPAMRHCFQQKNFSEQTVFLLGQMGRTFVPEWWAIQRAIIELVHELYRARQELVLQH